MLATLATRSFVAVGTPVERADDQAAPARIRAAFSELARRGVATGAFRHLMIEGGATAAATLAALGWDELAVAGEWAQGVVTLRPAAAPGILVTMKPGSYDWPESLWSQTAGLA